METIRLDAARLRGRQDAMDTLGAALSLPEWWGRNLDALYDCLTDLDRPVRLVVADAADLDASPFGRRLLRVLADAAADTPWLELELE